MILVDTSVWIDYFNGQENPQTDLLDAALIEGEVAIGDLIYLEILQGFRNDNDFKQAKQVLNTLDQHQMFGVGMPDKCADNYRKLRKKGRTIRKTADVIIATFCIDQKIPLLFTDRDFQPFVEQLNLIPALEMKQPNKTTVQAIRELKEGKGHKADSTTELFNDLKDESSDT